MKLPQAKWIAVGVFVALFIATFCVRCTRAADFEWQAGSTVVRAYTWSTSALIIFPRVIQDKADIRCKVQLYGPSSYTQESMTIGTPVHRVVENRIGVDQNGAFGCQVLSGWRHVDLGLGVVALSRADHFNSREDFWLTLRYRFTDHISANYDHHSNAGTNSPNYGRDFITLGYRF